MIWTTVAAALWAAPRFAQRSGYNSEAESENKGTRKLEEEQRVFVLRFAPIFKLAKP